MQEILDFCRGPLFRFSFLLMVFGLLRILVLDIWQALIAWRRAGDKRLAWKSATVNTLHWLFPIKKTFTRKPVYSLVSILFHVGLITVPIFLAAHITLWHESTGIRWWAMPHSLADWLTISTIVFALTLFAWRVLSRDARFLSRSQDYLWPILLSIPFITGYACVNTALSARAYEFSMLLHVLSANLIFVMIPFSKIAHCVIQPLSQFMLALAWKFPARIDDKIATTLKKKGAPV